MFLVVLERDQVARPVVPLVVVDVMDDRLWRARPPSATRLTTWMCS
jgi:hypothetical protein